jgi:hypothetical protein
MTWAACHLPAHIVLSAIIVTVVADQTICSGKQQAVESSNGGSQPPP